MKIRLLSAIVYVLALAAASAQSTPAAAAQTPAPSPAPAASQPQGGGGWQGQRGGQRGGEGGWGGGGLAGHGISGTVTGAATDHYTIKTDAGETYVVHISANTRILKQTAQRRGEGGEGGRTPPQELKPTDIKAGDAIMAVGETDATVKTVGAALILLIDPERAKQMREMQANYGKIWLMGKVTAINETRVTLLGTVDNVAHAFQADENTTFRKHREPITLADVQVGDMVRVEGAVKDGIFVAATVNVREMPPEGTPVVPRGATPAPAAQPK
jgi:hypothetical protein